MYESEDVAVYTWGEESYDGLGDALQEGGDDLNDETFGGSGAVGKDFDFANPSLPEVSPPGNLNQLRRREEQAPVQHGRNQQSEPVREPTRTSQAAPRSHPPNSLEAIWDDRSPFSVLPRSNGAGRVDQRASPSLQQPRFSPFAGADGHAHSNGGPLPQHGQTGLRTLREVEAEMQHAAQQNREAREREREHEREREAYLRRQQEILLRQEEENLLLQERQRAQLLREREQYAREQIQHEQMQREQQHQLQVQRLLLQQQREQTAQQQMRTPPPRLLPVSQSPRLHEHQQRQILLLQRQQEQQQLLHLQELQEQLRVEEIERQMMAGLNRMHIQTVEPPTHRRQPSGPTAFDLQMAQMAQLQMQRRQQSQSPAMRGQAYTSSISEGQFHNQQIPHRMVADVSPADIIREMQGSSQVEQEALRMEAMRKILEAEKMEEKRRRKAAKIAHMARYNDLMTQSDKDFITRIQVSQLVTQDPYADDFYAQVYSAILRSRLGLQSQEERVLKFGSGLGVGLGVPQKGGSRRQSALHRMEQQVERIVSNARKREEEKGLHSLHSLQGALGKTSGRSYKAAPRQLLHVDASSSASPTLSPAQAQTHPHLQMHIKNEGAAREAAKLGRETLGVAANTENLVRQDPLTQRQVLSTLEHLYDVVLRVEQLRRDQPLPEDEELFAQWQEEYDNSVTSLWDDLKVMVPLETSNPHPFISLVTPTKGKKLLPRLTRHLSHERMLTLLTLLVACFSQLDVVIDAPFLDTFEESQKRSDVERQTQAFLGSVLQSILPVVAKANLRLVTGLLSLLLHRTDIVLVAQSRPGLALLTLFLSRVEVIKQSVSSGEVTDIPSIEELQQWQTMFDHLFHLLTPHLLSLFPSTRIVHTQNSGLTDRIDTIDQPVWQFLAAMALHAITDQHHVLVTALREKVLEDVVNANKGWAAGDPEWQTKLSNVNLFLHALGLDSSQISM